jgi:RNA polymerase sigma-70 factor, ECF subfamily
MGQPPRSTGEQWDWRELGALALREARRVLVDRYDAEDAAQEAMIRAYRARQQCADPGAPDAWVRSIARREAYRLHARRPAWEPDADLLDREATGDSTEMVHDRLVAQGALRGTSATDRSLLMRRYVLDQTSSQIAEALELPAATVRVRLHRASKRIRERAAAIDGAQFTDDRITPRVVVSCPE